MKNYINKIFGCAILASATLLASCGSDYLETKPTASVSSTEAVATTDMAYKALNGIARCQTTQHYAFTQGFAGENAIIRLYENLPSQNYNTIMLLVGHLSITRHSIIEQVLSMTDMLGTIITSSSVRQIESLHISMLRQVVMKTRSLSRLQPWLSVLTAMRS